jgi:hypothetical protein
MRRTRAISKTRMEEEQGFAAAETLARVDAALRRAFDL